MDGWIRLYRSIEEHPDYFKEPFSRTAAWIDLLLLANIEQGTIYVRNIPVTVERGQVAMSEVQLAKRWKRSRETVRRFLHEWEDQEQILQKKTKLTTLITILNYNKYNTDKKSSKTGVPNNKIGVGAYNKNEGVTTSTTTTCEGGKSLHPTTKLGSEHTTDAQQPSKTGVPNNKIGVGAYNKNEGVTTSTTTTCEGGKSLHPTTKLGSEHTTDRAQKEIPPNNIIITPKEKEERSFLIIKRGKENENHLKDAVPSLFPEEEINLKKPTKNELKVQKQAEEYAKALKAGKNIPPTIEQIQAYLDEKRYDDVDADLFWNFYESKDWFIGKNKMKNWHSAIATWRKSVIRTRNTNYQKTSIYANDRTDNNNAAEQRKQEVAVIMARLAAEDDERSARQGSGGL